MADNNLAVVGLGLLAFAFLCLLAAMVSPTWLYLRIDSSTPEPTRSEVWRGLWCSEKQTYLLAKNKVEEVESSCTTILAFRVVWFTNMTWRIAQLASLFTILVDGLALVFGYNKQFHGQDYPLLNGVILFPHLLALAGGLSGAASLLAFIVVSMRLRFSYAGVTVEMSFMWGFYLYLLGVLLTFAAALVLHVAMKPDAAEIPIAETTLVLTNKPIQQGHVVQSYWL